MPNKNKIFAGFLVALGLVLLGGVQETHAATMYVWPAQSHFADGSTNSIYVGIDTQGASSNAADMILTYNPAEIDVISVRPGNAYEGYLAPQIGGGRAMLTGYSIGKNLTGKATFATVQIKNKPGVTKASVSFAFSPGSTTDSNVADLSSADILTGVGRGNYTFGKVEKAAAPAPVEVHVDETSPTVTRVYPSPDTEGVPANSVVHFYVEDDDSGVLLKTVRVTVNDTAYTVTNQDELKFIAYGKNNKKYSITVIPDEPFEEGEPVNVRIEVRDNAGNWVKPVEFAFNKSGTALFTGPTTPLEGTLCDIFETCSGAIQKWKVVEKVILAKGLNYHASVWPPKKSDQATLKAAASNAPMSDLTRWISWVAIAIVLLVLGAFIGRRGRRSDGNYNQWRK